MLRFLLLLVLSGGLAVGGHWFEITSTYPPIAWGQASLASLEQAIHDQVNQYRFSQNLPPLQLDERISREARLHSQQMASGVVPFSHQGFEQRVEAIAASIPYRSAGENLAYNLGYQDPVTAAVEGWIESPSHQENMVGDFNLTGVGIAQNQEGRYYFTQIFLLTR